MYRQKIQFLLLSLIPVFLYGQVKDTVDIPEVEYRSPRMYVPLFQEQIQSVDSAELSTYADQTMTDLLLQESHLIIKSYGSSSLSTASFRGKAASHTGVYWNGLRINSPLLGQVDMNTIPITAIDKLSILAGNASLQTGSGSIGGAIVMNSGLSGVCYDCREGADLKIKGVQKIASFGERSTSIQYKQAKGNIAYGIGAYYRRAENDFEFLNTALRSPRRDTQFNAQYEQWGITTDFRFIPDRSNNKRFHDTLNFSMWYQSFDRQIPPQMPDLGVERDESQSDKNLRSSLSYKFRKNGNLHNFNLGITAENTDYEMYFLIPNQAPYEQFNADSKYRTAQLQYRYRTTFAERNHFNISTSHTYQWAHYNERRSGTDFYAQRYTGEMQATYLNRFSRKWHTEIVTNATLYHPGKLQFNGSAGVFYRFAQKENKNYKKSSYTIGFQVGRNTHQPTLNDLYWEPGGNPDLATEKSIEFSLPVKYQMKKLNSEFLLQLKPYYSDVRDWILWQPSQYRFWSPINLRHVVSTGVEANLDYSLQFDKFASKFRSSYTFSPTLDVEVGNEVNFKKQLLPYVPLHSGQFSYSGTYTPFNLQFQYSIQFNGARYVEEAQLRSRNFLPAYRLHNAHISYHTKFQKFNSKILFRIENLWDKNYQSIQWRPMPGRHYSLLIQLNFIQ